ncbi:MAG TPA: hypothetical protein VKZ51_05770 [Cyclobacteriaceae bacterium]|nr:hypothetical protein [Cyclobacteriaceae bacterium]
MKTTNPGKAGATVKKAVPEIIPVIPVNFHSPKSNTMLSIPKNAAFRIWTA